MKQFSELGFPPEQQLFADDKAAMRELFTVAFEVLLELHMAGHPLPTDRQLRRAMIPLLNRYKLFYAKPTVEAQSRALVAGTVGPDPRRFG